MKQEMQRTTFQSITHVLNFVIVGSTIGFVSGILQDPSFGGFVPLASLIGLLVGVYLSWVYKSEKVGVKILAGASIGIVLGMFLGSVLGGFLGTFFSFLFPSSFFTPIFLMGTVTGMLLLSAKFPIIIVNWLLS
ncbi:MAG: hypothetical protein DWQ04_12625 [Chloroflexi bacterium]|nr:MAG: hypothetical protein DWQ04_12625 [Chloroflexota bacterium]